VICVIKDDGALALANALMENANLVQLFLGGNRPGPPGAVKRSSRSPQ
jgi:hypothetical protein